MAEEVSRPQLSLSRSGVTFGFTNILNIYLRSVVYNLRFLFNENCYFILLLMLVTIVSEVCDERLISGSLELFESTI
jgi:hypothetical protein